MAKAVYMFDSTHNCYRIKEDTDVQLPIAVVDVDLESKTGKEKALEKTKRLVDGWNATEMLKRKKCVPKKLGGLIRRVLEGSDGDVFFEGVKIIDVELVGSSKFKTEFLHKHSLPNCPETISVSLSEVIALS